MAVIKTKYSRKQLLTFSNEELMEKTNNRAIDLYLNDSRLTQLGANDLQRYDSERLLLYTRTGITINLLDIEHIEVIEYY